MNLVVLGGGVAGSTFAALMAKAGHHVWICDRAERPSVVVGESLVPGLVPILRRLGVEERIAAFSKIKRGVAFHFHEDRPVSFTFASLTGSAPRYAYNVPRPQFDEVLAQRAEELGARRVPVRCSWKADAGDGGLASMADLAREIPGLESFQPDLVVDATGRSRLCSRLFRVPAWTGPRTDAAYFAHYRGFRHDEEVEGQVKITRHAHGWSWRIPLQDRLSVGIVMNKDAAKGLGATPAERMEAAIDSHPDLAAAGAGRERISDVEVFTNYQLISHQGYGDGWVAIGDAFGFVDPMLSPGAFMAMKSAELLADQLHASTPATREAALRRYDAEMRLWLDAWREIVESFYDGRVFAFERTGRMFLDRWPHAPMTWMQGYIQRHFAGIASGITTTDAWSRGMMRWLFRHGIYQQDPATWAVA